MEEKTFTAAEVVSELMMAAALMGADLAPETASAFIHQMRKMGATGAEIVQAAHMVATEEDYKLTLKKLLSRIPRLQYPDAEVAWATFPKDESQTACVAEPAQKAWGQCSGLWYDGDRVAARMAFKAAYEQFVAEAKQSGNITPKWVMTLGRDASEREEKIREAVAHGKLLAKSAKVYLPHLTDDELANPALPAPAASLALLEAAAEEAPSSSKEEAKEQISKLKNLLRAG